MVLLAIVFMRKTINFDEKFFVTFWNIRVKN